MTSLIYSVKIGAASSMDSVASAASNKTLRMMADARMPTVLRWLEAKKRNIISRGESTDNIEEVA